MSSPAEFYHSLPPIIKFYGTTCLLLTTVERLGLVSGMLLYFSPELAFKKLQLWRAVTNFFFLGTFSMNFAIQLIMLARYGVQLERSFVSTGQFVWMMVVSALTLLGIATVFPSLNFWFMGSVLVFMLVYLWSREFPNASVSMLGLVTIQGFYVPWAMLFINTMFGGSFLHDLLGIVMGHLYHFLTVLYPRSGGRDFLRAPRFVHKLLAKYGIIHSVPRQPDRSSRPQPQAESPPSAPPSAAEGTAFRGRSYRLNRD
ncbi:hypothetical protein SELMODRAFT_266761 [Selaginella moellendorffii]|uniref:Derlin n=1 Tax=Selaginella moellendorffii TaxID=88036 RepID=D8QZL0_SELML|nr:derlin-1 [Selaginella moellendorffii]XP_002975310.1 derlin-1 [Selaginella moellendorffii]EFJ23511.1 hypothetical protein SELMODRAFT_415487 [Selaginella moellendorffii]EFJ34818.1 hypothetical protein SELMODRAFT_266761 [Selaginella moellendorffii]|eukprot:XP_002964485.1 derlin-1 [Selaginella moellendorffii]